MESCDIMISYHISDIELVKYLHGELTKEGFDTWYIKPEDIGDRDEHMKMERMVIYCKVYMVLLSEVSVKSPEIKDEMSLAHTFRKPIYPLSTTTYTKLDKDIEIGMKLILAKINWTCFTRPDQYNESMGKLIEYAHTEIDGGGGTARRRIKEFEEIDQDEDEYATMGHQAQMHLQPAELQYVYGQHGQPGQASTSPRQSQSHCIQPQQVQVMRSSQMSFKDDKAAKPMPGQHPMRASSDFWQRHFGDTPEQPWSEFEDAFLLDYEHKINEDFGEEKVAYFLSVIHKDVFKLKSVIPRTDYYKFVGRNSSSEKDHFYEKLRYYASSSLALREVLDMESTVRLTAISNLGQFQTKGVTTLLFNFVTDDDPNIRAVAALSLAKTGKKTKRIEDQLMRMLDDEDRVVRESACLSLAHIRCQRAVKPIVDLWRNDAIKHVREAAEIALARIGGEEAGEAMQVTQILSSEMAKLCGTQA